VAVFEEKYPGFSDQQAIEEFISRLLLEELISEKIAESLTEETLDFDTIATYLPPIVEKYTDMQDLLMLDPIHDIDETGWPNKAPQLNQGNQE